MNSPDLRGATFNPPEPLALARVGRLIASAYNDSLLQVLYRPDQASLRKISEGYEPYTWTWNETGTGNVVLINGVTNQLAEVPPVSLGYADGGSGFYDVIANSVFRMHALNIYRKMPLDTKVIIGHSMGGAVAALVGQIMRKENPESDVRVIAIGSPGFYQQSVLGDSTNMFSPSWLTHISHHSDPVQYMPGTPVPIAGWQHGGRQWHLDDHGKLTMIDDRVLLVAAVVTNYVAWGTEKHSSLSYQSLFLRVTMAANVGRWNVDP